MVSLSLCKCCIFIWNWTFFFFFLHICPIFKCQNVPNIRDFLKQNSDLSPPSGQDSEHHTTLHCHGLSTRLSLSVSITTLNFKPHIYIIMLSSNQEKHFKCTESHESSVPRLVRHCSKSLSVVHLEHRQLRPVKAPMSLPVSSPAPFNGW